MDEKHLRGFTYIITLIIASLIVVGCTLISMQVTNTQGDDNQCKNTKSTESATDLNSPDICSQPKK